MTNHSTTSQAMHTPAFQIPRPAGWWIIGDASLGLQVPLGYRPMWLHRTMTSLLLGWEWKDDD